MAEENKVFIEKFLDFDIFYDKDEETFVADKAELDIHFRDRSLFQLKGDIKHSKTEQIDKEAIIKSGYFDKELAKIKILTQNKLTKRFKYEVVETTDHRYDEGRIKEDDDLKIYPLSKENLSIFDEVEKLEKEIEKIEDKQRELIKKLAK